MYISILDINSDNSDIEILHHIENLGIDYFISKFPEINTLEKKDQNYIIYCNYLNLYLIDDICDEKCIIYKNLILEIKKNISLIDIWLLVREEYKKEFWENLLQILFTLDTDIDSLYDNCVKNRNIMQYICQTKYWDYQNNTNTFLEYYLYKQYSKNNDIKFLENRLFNLIFPILKKKETRKYVVSWFSEVYNQNLLRKNISNNSNDHNIIESDIKILIIASVCLKTFIRGINLSKLEKICLKYSLDEDSKILWIDNPVNFKIEYTYLTQSFFINHKLLEISLINLYEELELNVRDVKYLNSKLKTEENPYYMQALKVRIDTLEKRVDTINILLSKNSEFIDECNIFYQNTLYWIDSNKENFTENSLLVTDTIINNFNIYMKNQKTCSKFLDKSFYSLFLVFLKQNHITKNPHVISLFIKLFNESLYTNDIVKGFCNDKCPQIIDCLINAYINLDKSFESNGNEKLMPQLLIIDIFNYLNFNMEIKYDIQIVIDKNQIIFKKFINIFIGNLSNIADNTFTNLRDLAKKQKENPNHEELENCEINVKHYIFELTHCFNLLKTLTNFYPNYFVQIGITDKFTSTINFMVYELLGEKKNELKIINPEKYNFKPILFLEYIYSILINMLGNEDFKKSIAYESRYYNCKYYDNLIKILIKSDKITLFDIENIKFIVTEIKNYYLKLKDEEDVEIPEEFCDPIMSTLIENPIILPNTDIFMDKDIITRHLLSDEHNPFNREKLTIEMLEEWNKKDEIMAKINEFNHRLSDWKSKIDL